VDQTAELAALRRRLANVQALIDRWNKPRPAITHDSIVAREVMAEIVTERQCAADLAKAIQ